MPSHVLLRNVKLRYAERFQFFLWAETWPNALIRDRHSRLMVEINATGTNLDLRGGK
jgi:hypothetical protein